MRSAPRFDEQLARLGPQAAPRDWTLAEAERYCLRLASSHYENFSVLSRLAPRSLRQPLANVYAYCRWADDLADEVRDASESLRLLAWWERQLDELSARGAEAAPTHPVFVALAATIREFALPADPFKDLLAAFRQDQQTLRYPTVESLRAYCRGSAEPVGRLVLHLGRSASAENVALSDSICAGLQWINFCQDVWPDWQRGRVYLPQTSLAASGYAEELLARRCCNDAYRRWIEGEVERAEHFLRAGQPLIESVQPPLRMPVALFVGGGLAIAAQIRRQKFNTLHRRPTVSRCGKLRLAAATWRRLRRSHAAEASLS